MSPLDLGPRCARCGPGFIAFRSGDYYCVRCGKPAWITERLKTVRMPGKTGTGVSAAWRVRA